MMLSALGVLAVQGVLGALDNLLHHELQARLPSRVSARTEIALHAVREGAYAVVFLGLAWAEWRGLWAWALFALLIAEVGVTIADFLEEDRTRVLPQLERALHTVLAVGYGAFLAAFAPVWLAWAASPTAVVATDYGPLSWLLSLYGVGVGAWSVRNAVAAWSLARTAKAEARARLAPPSGRRVLVAGGTGFIGGHLVNALRAAGDEVLVLTRDARQARAQFGAGVRAIDDLSLIPSEMRIDAVVNLAGASVTGGLWTPRRQMTLIESRVGVTRALIALMERLERKPEALVVASGVGFYGVRGDERLDELAGYQSVFQSRLCQMAEAAAADARRLGVRVAAARFGVVLGRDGGLLPLLALASWFGFGARLGDGRQYFPWAHIDDAVGLIARVLEDKDVEGPVNVVAPSNVRQGDFAGILARVQGRPRWLAVPAWPMRVALGELAQLLLDGQRVIPQRALQMGFRYEHATLEEALRDLLGSKTPVIPSDARDLEPKVRSTTVVEPSSHRGPSSLRS